MRRFLAIVLLALLPLQFSWAAVGSYCQHESAAVDSGRQGHAELQHHAEPAFDDASSGDSAQSSGEVDVDCGHCHGHCTAMLPPLNHMHRDPSTVPPSARVGDAGGAHASPRPERPQWPPLA